MSGLMTDDDIRFYRLKEIIHFVTAAFKHDTSLITHYITLRDTRRPDIGAAIAGYFHLLHIMPVKMEIPLVKRRIFQIHVIITGQSKYLGFLFCRKNIFKKLIFLME